MLTNNDLLVLGILLDRPMHGYELSQHVKAEGIPVWFDISTAAIYYSLNKLRREGLVSETQSGAHGEKTIYRTTEKGREQFFDKMEDVLASEEPVRFDYDLGILLLNRLPHERALGLLEERMAFLRERQATLDQLLECESSSGEALKAAILEHAASCTRVESRWLGSIVQHLRGGSDGRDGYGGLMRLSGDLHEFHLPNLIKLVASGKHSGRLSVSDGAHKRTISFREGGPVCATSERPEGEVQDPDRVLKDVYDLFRWQEGSFTLDQRMKPSEGCTVVTMSAYDLILAGARWVDNWSTIQQVVPSAETVFEHRDGPVAASALNLDALEEQVFKALDGLRDVSDVARACGITEFEASKTLYGLCTVGLVRPGDRGKIRLRRVFREFAELLCRATIPYREAPDDYTCEESVNERCSELPVRFVASRIEDQTDPALTAEELADIYRSFLLAQRAVVEERFGHDVADEFLQQVRSRIHPSLRTALVEHELISAD